MDEIINAILCSPSLDLTEHQIVELSHLVSQINTITLDAFNKHIKTYLKRHPDSLLKEPEHQQHIEKFISAWEKITKHLQDLKDKINLAFSRLVSQTGADDCMPVFVRLLKINETNLFLLKAKLRSAGNVFTSNEIGYDIMTLYGCVMYQLMTSSFKRSSSSPSLNTQSQSTLSRCHSAANFRLFASNEIHEQPLSVDAKKYEKRAQIVLHDINNFSLMQQYQKLKSATEAYLDNLKLQIVERIRTIAPEVYSDICAMDGNELNEATLDQLRTDNRATSALRLLIEKYMCLKGFCITLELSDRELTDVIKLFSEQYQFHDNVLNQKPSVFSISGRSWHSYYLLPKYALNYTIEKLPINNYESAFHSEARQSCEMIKKILDEKKQFASTPAINHRQFDNTH